VGPRRPQDIVSVSSVSALCLSLSSKSPRLRIFNSYAETLRSLGVKIVLLVLASRYRALVEGESWRARARYRACCRPAPASFGSPIANRLGTRDAIRDTCGRGDFVGRDLPCVRAPAAVEHRFPVSRLHAQRAEFHFFSVRRHAPRPSGGWPGLRLAVLVANESAPWRVAGPARRKRRGSSSRASSIEARSLPSVR